MNNLKLRPSYMFMIIGIAITTWGGAFHNIDLIMPGLVVFIGSGVGRWISYMDND